MLNTILTNTIILKQSRFIKIDTAIEFTVLDNTWYTLHFLSCNMHYTLYVALLAEDPRLLKSLSLPSLFDCALMTGNIWKRVTKRIKVPES
jgi:hypothetical protein